MSEDQHWCTGNELCPICRKLEEAKPDASEGAGGDTDLT